MSIDFQKWTDNLGPGAFNADVIQQEVVIDTKTGEPRQAGADQANAEWIKSVRQAAESSLFVMCKAILGMSRLTVGLHLGVCDWLQRIPPYRKLYLLPRDCLKTSIARGLMMHLLIQPKQNNIYFPNCREIGCSSPLDCQNPAHRFEGRNTRIMYGGETDRNAEKQLAWAMATWQSNPLLRALWPQCAWDNPRKESDKWSAQALLIRRDKIFPEASIESIGVGGAVTGRHYDVLIKDDIATLKAANSRTVMEDTIEWNRATRALMDDPDKSLEFMLGTRWAPGDVWETVKAEDQSVDVMSRALVEDGKSIFPELFSMATIERLKKEEKHLFPLIRMNSSADRAIADFMPEDLRECRIEEGYIVFDADGRDQRLQAMLGGRHLNLPTGTKLTPRLLQEVAASGQRLRIG